jgi:hypothetical protein
MFSRRGATEAQMRAAAFSITFYATGYSAAPTSPTQKPGKHGQYEQTSE